MHNTPIDEYYFWKNLIEDKQEAYQPVPDKMFKLLALAEAHFKKNIAYPVVQIICFSRSKSLLKEGAKDELLRIYCRQTIPFYISCISCIICIGSDCISILYIYTYWRKEMKKTLLALVMSAMTLQAGNVLAGDEPVVILDEDGNRPVVSS